MDPKTQIHSDLFTATYRELPESEYLQPKWSDLWRVPWGLIVAVFYLFPKDLIQHWRGKEEEHHEEGFEEPLPGWHPWKSYDGVQVLRHYDYAGDYFKDHYWHLADGYRLRTEPEFPGLPEYFLVRRSFCDFAGGLIAQAIMVEGERENCPLVFIDFRKSKVDVLLPLDQVALLQFNREGEGRLRITGESEKGRFELLLEKTGA